MSTNRKARAATTTVLVIAALFLWPGDLLACPVCYGEAEEPVIDGARWSIIFLGGLLYAMIGGGLTLFLLLRRRAQRLQEPQRGLRLVESR
ncbi:MAG: hypothetical protein AAF481_13730 [Acidobacteriota bacterium]